MAQSLDQSLNPVVVISKPGQLFEDLAVNIKNAVFEYKKDQVVLDSLSLKIQRGKIFALLGPNGTGKSTLMRTILGRLELKSGSIRVFGEKPGSKFSNVPGIGVGYMPQELALFEEFTIKEILNYYGTVYHMNSQHLKQRIIDLIHILNLPSKKRLIKQLSGGQQRRVSMAITMIHSPKLLILDEPTVGVDSLLRFRIWEYLEECCHKNGQTVLITTHYIEEARSADDVAFMSYGTILKQSDPQTLLRQYNCQTLEAVFLKLCEQRKERRKSIKPAEIIRQMSICETLTEDPDEDTDDKTAANAFDFQRVKAMLYSYYTSSVRRPVFLYLFYFLPLLVLTSQKLAIGQSPSHIPMVIFNQDQNPEYSQAIINNIDNQSVIVKMVDNFESAYQSVVDGSNYMSVVFGRNFSDDFQYRLKDSFDITDEEVENTKIKVYLDSANVPMTIFVLKYLLMAFNKFLRNMGHVFGQNAERFFHPVAIEEVVYGEFEFNLAQIFGPGILIAITQVLPLIISALQIVVDRKNLCLERILVSGVRPIEIMCAHFIENCFLISTQLLLTLFINFFVFQNVQIGSYLDIYLLLFLIGLQGMAIGLTIALISKNEAEMMGAIACLVLPQWMISGIFWPLEAIPLLLQPVILLTPMAQPLLSLRSIMLRGWSLGHPMVYMGLISALLYFVILSLFNIFFFRRLVK